MDKIKKVIFLLVVFLFVGRTKLDAGGLATNFAEVFVENLEIGGTYSLKKLSRLSVNAINNSDKEVNLKMEVLIPSEKELKEGFEALPDKDWLKLEEDTFIISPRGTVATDLIISIPNEEKYLGKRYQAFVWMCTVPDAEGFGAIGIGLKGRLLFSINSEVSLGKKELALIGNLNFSIEPEVIYFEDLQRGRTYSIRDSKEGILKIKNSEEQTLSYKIESIDVKTSSFKGSLVGEGYQPTPTPEWITISEPEFTLASGEEKEIDFSLKIPREWKDKEKKYVFILHITQGSVGKYAKVCVEIK